MPESIDKTPSADIRETMSRGKNDASDYGVRGPLFGSSESVSIQGDIADNPDKEPEQMDLFSDTETVTPVRVSTVTPVQVSPPSDVYRQARARNAELIGLDQHDTTSAEAGRIAASQFLNDRLNK
jgi:hypothetical protein